MPLGITWSPEEDLRLAELVRVHGPKKWSQIASELKTNKGSKQCRRRWKNFLSLDERKLGSWTPEEDAQLLECHRKHGNKWTLIAQEIGGRTDNAVKNRWAALEKKRRSGDDADYPQQPRSSSLHRGNSDLLRVRRIISKDQPTRSFSSSRQQHPALYEADWMQQQQEGAAAGTAAAAAAAAAGGQQQQQQDQSGYTLQQPGSVPSSSMPMLGGSKPDLKINIPSATAELPYSQRPLAGGADPSRLQKGNLTPVEVWLGSSLPGMEQGKPEDDALLSTSRQGAQAAMVGLATPSDQPGWPQDLCSFLITPGAQHFAAAAAAAAAAAGQAQQQQQQQQAPAHHGRGPAAPWRDMSVQSMPQTQQQQQQMPPAQQQLLMLPTSSGSYMQQQHQQQLYQPPPKMPGQQQDQAGMAIFMGQQQQQQQQPGRMVPPPGLHYSQPQLQQQPVHNLSKLSRTVSGFDPAVLSASMPQPSLPEGMMLRQGLQPPQPRFVPQGLPEGPGMAGMGGGKLMTHNNAAVTTASGPFQPSDPQLGAYPPHQMQRGAPGMAGALPGHEQQHMLHRQQQQQQQTLQRLPVLGQPQQPPAPHLMPQQNVMQQPPGMMMRPQGLVGPGAPLAPPQGTQVVLQHPPALAPAPPAPAPQAPPSHQSWNACELRQLMELLQEQGAAGDAQQALPPAPPLCHMPHLPVVDEHANNMSGGMATAP